MIQARKVVVDKEAPQRPWNVANNSGCLKLAKKMYKFRGALLLMMLKTNKSKSRSGLRSE